MRIEIVEIQIRAPSEHLPKNQYLTTAIFILSKNDRCSIYTPFAATVNRRYGRAGSSDMQFAASLEQDIQDDCDHR
jgi:hypothetical protein